jgi:hypothetical protein
MRYWKRTPHHHLITEVKFIRITSVIKIHVSYNSLKLWQHRHVFNTAIPHQPYYIWIWKYQDWEVDQQTDGKMKWGRMEEAPENGKESSHSAHANGMNEWIPHQPRSLHFLKISGMSYGKLAIRERMVAINTYQHPSLNT